MLERDIEKAVCEYAKKNGVLSFKIPASQYGNSAGWPDRVFLYQGRTLFVEFKAPGKTMTPLQEVQARKLQKVGYPVWMIDNRENGKDLIDEFLEHNVDK